ncbi:MAG: CCA tRNA nucleotidyltransferase [Oscillospiraceae bacterium]|jgi:tRNA nucleotidyltransferase (CCA-adding enzyme)|nr:CCA tRNA nucleotidyltransferase [Oscillospiraceae bacterium]
MNISPPEYAAAALRALESRGFEAFLVGGCVRDAILGRRPADWDICTSATPQEMAGVFARSYPTGIKHGTLTVISRGRALEATTYRTDGAYSDNRRPDTVSFVSDLREDLARRDFTMNAIALSSRGELVDPFGGREDLAARLIRCVGEPDARFREDALRILRALRFSAVLGFEMEAQTREAVYRNAPLIQNVARERVSAELTKALSSDRPEIAAEMLGLSGLIPALPEPPDKRLGRIKRLRKAPAQRWAALAALLTQDGVLSAPEELLLKLKLDGATARAAVRGSELALKKPPETAADWKRCLCKHGEGTARAAAAAMSVLYGGALAQHLRAVLRSGEPYRISDLALGGRQLLELGLVGERVGSVQRALLERVIIAPEDNTEEKLREIVEKMI